ncbi:sulfite exporter TauE/SafE family protein [Aestuariicella hydrocarbonica]|uniref:Probable membrane transporter protein n=1 Tax=Pseudomaricurvus hydrocarbonicus TaxID=1470433 RepID=A0A9E5MLI0_9GAMM|nr:sulfite exporter TauE/SafE family protein [Aestuariicella hydrocarbonica]NHO64568.1 sulfite exporter TauE/SafE family protein [Aestuariicella hydrocarbonica]
MELTYSTLALTFAIFALACYIQTNTGFAFALIVMSLGGAFNVLPLSVLAYSVSFLSLVNSTTALRGALQHVDRQLLGWMLVSCIPGAIFGVWLLDSLSTHSQDGLRIAFGITIILCGLLMLQKPQPLEQRSSNGVVVGTGTIAGITGGLFAAFGPPIAYLAYRQPLPIKTILTTLLAVFWATAVLRIAIVSSMSDVPADVFWLIAAGVPWIVVCTWLSKRFTPPIRELTLRRGAMGLLMLSGLSVLLAGLKGLLQL